MHIENIVSLLISIVILVNLIQLLDLILCQFLPFVSVKLILTLHSLELVCSKASSCGAGTNLDPGIVV